MEQLIPAFQLIFDTYKKDQDLRIGFDLRTLKDRSNLELARDYLYDHSYAKPGPPFLNAMNFTLTPEGVSFLEKTLKDYV